MHCINSSIRIWVYNWWLPFFPLKVTQILWYIIRNCLACLSCNTEYPHISSLSWVTCCESVVSWVTVWFPPLMCVCVCVTRETCARVCDILLILLWPSFIRLCSQQMKSNRNGNKISSQILAFSMQWHLTTTIFETCNFTSAKNPNVICKLD